HGTHGPGEPDPGPGDHVRAAGHRSRAGPRHPPRPRPAGRRPRAAPDLTMLVFAASDKGGTGRSVTSVNVCYRRAIPGGDVCYVDFDFGSPTAGAIFEVGGLAHGTPDADGLHSYLHGEVTQPRQADGWAESDRAGLPGRPAG